MPEYGKDITAAKQKVLDILNTCINKMDKVTYAMLLQAIEETFDIQNHNIQNDKYFIKKLNKLTIGIIDLIQTNLKFTGPVSQLIKKDPSNSAAINTKLLKTFDYDGILMTGSLIDISSPQCKYVIKELGGTITRKNWALVKAIAEKHGLIEGTTFDNLPTNKLHKKCRHGLYPIMLKKPS